MKLLKWIEKNFELAILLVLLAAFSSVMMAQVIMRYIFNSPFSWAEELCRYFFIATVAFASAYCVRNDILLRVDIIVNFFPHVIQRFFKYVMWVIMIGTYFILGAGGIPVVQSAHTTKQVSPAVQVPMWWLYLLMDIGFFLTAVRAIQAVVKEILIDIKGKKHAADAGKEG